MTGFRSKRQPWWLIVKCEHASEVTSRMPRVLTKQFQFYRPTSFTLQTKMVSKVRFGKSPSSSSRMRSSCVLFFSVGIWNGFEKSRYGKRCIFYCTMQGTGHVLRHEMWKMACFWDLAAEISVHVYAVIYVRTCGTGHNQRMTDWLAN